MNLIEAVKSGRPSTKTAIEIELDLARARADRLERYLWRMMELAPDVADRLMAEAEGIRPESLDNKKEPEVRVTRTQFWEAIKHVWGPYEDDRVSGFSQLARRLGLESHETECRSLGMCRYRVSGT